MILEYKKLFETKLPPVENVIERNKKISSIYADLYLNHPNIFKWAGMASFASNHIGIGLLPYHLKNFELLDLSNSCKKQGLINDFNLLRHINNRIYEDIGWTHQAYLDGGISLLIELMEGDDNYQTMLSAWISLDEIIKRDVSQSLKNKQIWLANTKLLRHEQEMVVQPMFDRFGALFKKVLSLCASLDFSPNHMRTDFKYHSSFLWYTFRNQFDLIKKSKSIPDLTEFNQRWTWLENRVILNWIKKEQEESETVYRNVKIISNAYSH